MTSDSVSSIMSGDVKPSGKFSNVKIDRSQYSHVSKSLTTQLGDAASKLEIVGLLKPSDRYTPRQPDTTEYSRVDEFERTSRIEVPEAGKVREYQFDTPNAGDLVGWLGKFSDLPRAKSSCKPCILKEAIERTTKRMHGDHMIHGWWDPAYLLEVTYPKMTSAGLYYNKRKMRHKKKDAIEFAARDAVQKYSTLLAGFDRHSDDRPASLAARGRRKNAWGVGKEYEGRMIMNVDFSDFLISSICSRPYLEVMRSMSKACGGPMIGISKSSRKWIEFAKVLGDYDEYLCLDYSGFDQSLPAWLISTAFDVVATAFAPCRFKKTYFEREKRLMIRTLIALPSGDVVRKRSGICSGNPWTSIIGSVCGQLIIEYYASLMGWEPGTYAGFVYGDDAVIAKKDGTPGHLNIEHMAAVVGETFNVKMKPEATSLTRDLFVKLGRDGEPVNKPVQFLSSMFLEPGLPYRTFYEVYLRLYVPERMGVGPGWEMARTYSYYIENYWNPRARNYLHELFQYIKYHYAGNRHFTKRDLLYDDDVLTSQLGIKLAQWELPTHDSICAYYYSPESTRLVSP